MANEPQDPNSPQGPGSQQPIDPGVANVFERMAQALNLANDKAANSEKLLQSMAEHAGAVAQEAEKASVKLKDMFKLSDDIEDNYKKIVEYGKKRSQQSIKEFTDAKKARKELEEIVKLYEAGLKGAKGHTKEAQAMTRNLTDVRKILKALPRDGDVLEGQLQKIAGAFENASRNAKDLVRSMSNLSRSGATVKGSMGILSSMGIGRGVHAKMEQRMAAIQEVKDKVKEARELRRSATVKHMMGKREKAVEQLQANGIDVGTDAGRDLLARKMGFKTGTPKYSKFITGEQAGGAAANGEAGVGWHAAMSEGGGAIEGAAATFETGIEGLMMGLEAVAVPLTLLAGVIELLIAAFDGYVKQNQDIEKNLGKAGIFNQAGIGGGEAFARARDALTPPVGLQGLGLGMSFERNIALAGAMTNAGFTPRPGAPGMGNQANLAPGAQGEFMKGSMGEAQRVVMGVSRIGGLTDAEGTENLIKLLESYQETMASSEMFMARINKDTQAAGISTTKYLKIIDEVNGSFDKMGKSLEQVTGIMRELTRYGGISSETLKDLMEGLLNAGAKPGMGDAALAGYAQSVMSSPLLDATRKTEQKTLQNYISNLNSEAKRAGIEGMNPDEINELVKRGDFKGAEEKANQMRGRVLQITDVQQRQTMEGALQKVQQQIPHVADVMQGSAMGRVFGMSNHGKTPAEQLSENFSLLNDIARKSGLSMEDIFAGKGGESSQGIVTGLNEMFKQKGFGSLAEFSRVAGSQAVADVRGTVSPTEQRSGAKVLFNEFYKGAKTKEGIAAFLTEKGLGKFMKDNGEDQLDNIMSTKDGMDAFLKVADGQADVIGSGVDQQKKMIAAMSEGNETSDATLAHNLETARQVGSRTQTVEDLLKNVFKPLLTALLESVEFIATAISHLIPGSDFQKDQKRIQGDFQAIPKAVDSLTKNIDSLTSQREPLENQMQKGMKLSDSDQKTYDDLTKKIQSNTATITQLNSIASQGTFLSASQMKDVEGALTNIGQGKTANMNPNSGGDSTSWLGMAAKLALSPTMLAGAAAYGAFQDVGGGDIYNTYYSSDTTQDNTAPTTVASSPTDHATAPKPQVARRPMDNR